MEEKIADLMKAGWAVELRIIHWDCSHLWRCVGALPGMIGAVAKKKGAWLLVAAPTPIEAIHLLAERAEWAAGV